MDLSAFLEIMSEGAMGDLGSVTYEIFIRVIANGLMSLNPSARPSFSLYPNFFYHQYIFCMVSLIGCHQNNKVLPIGSIS